MPAVGLRVRADAEPLYGAGSGSIGGVKLPWTSSETGGVTMAVSHDSGCHMTVSVSRSISRSTRSGCSPGGRWGEGRGGDGESLRQKGLAVTVMRGEDGHAEVPRVLGDARRRRDQASLVDGCGGSF
jgi:hypothetical protein